MAARDLLLADATVKAVAALLELVPEYQPGKALQSVLDFQKAWVAVYPLVRGEAGIICAPDPNKFLLDGKYGPMTGCAMSTFIVGIAKKLSVSLSWDSMALNQVLPRRASNVPMWGVKNRAAVDAMRIWLTQIRNQPAPPQEPEIPITPAEPPVQPVAPPVAPGQPAPVPAPAPQKPAIDPGVLKAIALNTRAVCTEGFTNVFRNVRTQKLIWVKDAVESAFRRDPNYDFVRKQLTCKPIVLATPFEEDKTRIIAGVGLALTGVGAAYWFFLRKKKKR